MIVGAECLHRWRVDMEQRLSAEQAAYFSRSTYETDVARVRKSKGKDADALDDVEFSRREMARTPDEDEEADRIVHFAVPRPYRLQRSIIADVAAWASKKFAKPVTEGVVRSAWEAMKAVERDSRSV